MTKHTAPIVGSYFRPPAKAIIQSIGLDFPLRLRREPQNPHDSNAISIWLRSADLPPSADADLDLYAGGFGWNAATIRAEPEWHLGYIPRTIAVDIAARLDAAERSEIEGKLSFDLKGGPTIIFDME